MKKILVAVFLLVLSQQSFSSTFSNEIKTGWPTAILCNQSNGNQWMLELSSLVTPSGLTEYYSVGGTATAYRSVLRYKSNGDFDSSVNLSGDWDCITNQWSINELKTSGRAYYPPNVETENKTVIDSVAVDYSLGKINISGSNLTENSQVPIVKLAGQTLSICSSCFTNTNITADLPVGITDGNYSLKLFVSGKSFNDFSLTIGAVGPQGDPGSAGADGKDGADGAPGTPGKDGKDGAPGTPGANGKDGADGRNGIDGKDGADGTPGNLALAGQVCNGTTVPKGYDANGDIVCGEILSSSAGGGSALLPSWVSGFGNSTSIDITNISNSASTVKIKFYDYNGNIYNENSESVMNFSYAGSFSGDVLSSSGATLGANKTMAIYINTTQYLFGYGIIEWSSTDSKHISILAHGIKSYSGTYPGIAVIEVNDSNPF